MKPLFSRRLCAYLIDIIIVLFISVSVTSFIPTSEKVKTLTEKMNEVVTLASEKEISFEKYSTEINNINYDLTKETVISNLLSIIIYILYFVIYPVYNNGQTIGKKLLKLKVINIKEKKLTFNNLLFRELLLHSIALNIIINIVVLFVNENSFISINNILNITQEAILFVIIIMIITRKDGRGFHDILGNTMVINKEE